MKFRYIIYTIYYLYYNIKLFCNADLLFILSSFTKYKYFNNNEKIYTCILHLYYT